MKNYNSMKSNRTSAARRTARTPLPNGKVKTNRKATRGRKIKHQLIDDKDIKHNLSA